MHHAKGPLQRLHGAGARGRKNGAKPVISTCPTVLSVNLNWLRSRRGRACFKRSLPHDDEVAILPDLSLALPAGVLESARFDGRRLICSPANRRVLWPVRAYWRDLIYGLARAV